jgi:glycosyltransferase involved in cell wall biosynthesis
MKVVLLCNYPFTKVFSGSNIYNEKLAAALSVSDQVELHLVTNGPPESKSPTEALTIHAVQPGRIPYYYDPLLFQKMRAVINEIRPDIVHALSTELLYSTVAASVSDRYPTLLTVYGIAAVETEYFKREYTKLRQHIYRWMTLLNERYVLSTIPELVLDSPTVKEHINARTGAAIHIVPAGIELDQVRSAIIANAGMIGPDIFLVTNLEYLKGVDVLIEAVAKVRETFPEISVWIGGKGPQREELEEQVRRLNLEEQIRFLGFVSDEEKYRNYALCRLVVVASRWDCQPAALFEAAALGKPVIASDRSNPGIVEEGVTGFVFPSEDTSVLAERIVHLLADDSLRARMGQTALERVAAYDWKAVAERYVQIYHQMITRIDR